MAENETTTTTTTAIVIKHNGNDANKPNPIVSFFTNLLQSFNFPPQKKIDKTEKVLEATVIVPKKTAVVKDEEVVESKAVTVTYPVNNYPVVEPLKLEADELEKDTSPAVLWQVYAIGGFFILRWALARWKERKANRPPPDEPSNEDPPANQ